MHLNQEFVIGFVLAFLCTAVGVEALRHLAPRLGFIDQPGGRKHHETPTPVVGGLAMAVGLFSSWTLVPETGPLLAWQLGFSAFVVLGAVDDFLHIRAGAKFLLQAFVASCVVVASGSGLVSLGEVLPGWVVALGWLAVPFSVFAIVSVMNAINMTDGVDGLAGSLSVVALLALALMAYLGGRSDVALVALLPVAALCGFLVFNLRGPSGRPARVFMGDAGSLGMGFLIAVVALKVASADRVGVPPAVVIWVCFVPLSDGLSVILSRLSRRSGAMRPGRDHLHHLLLARGFAPIGVVAAEAGLAVAAALLGIFGWQAGLPDWVLVAAFAAAFLAFHILVSRAWLGLALGPPEAVDAVPTEAATAAEQAGS